MQPRLFRQQALESLSSPDQLDQLIRVTPPRAWLALIALAGLIAAALVWGVLGSIPRTVSGQGLLLRQGGVFNVQATAGGVIRDMPIAIGDAVAEGQTIATLASIGSTVDATIASPYTGRVLELFADPGTVVTPGQPILSVEFPDRPLDAVLYVPAGPGKQIQPGMRAEIVPATVRSEEYGFLAGTVGTVSTFPVTQRGAMRLLENDQLVRQFLGGGPVLEVEVRLEPDPSTPSGFRWSSSAGPALELSPGTTATGLVVLSEQRPLSLALPVARP